MLLPNICYAFKCSFSFSMILRFSAAFPWTTEEFNPDWLSAKVCNFANEPLFYNSVETFQLFSLPYQRSVTSITPLVKVPVLSEQIICTRPKASTSLQSFTKAKSRFFNRSLAYCNDTIKARFNPSGTFATINPIANTTLLITLRPKETLKTNISNPAIQDISVTTKTNENTSF